MAIFYNTGPHDVTGGFQSNNGAAVLPFGAGISAGGLLAESALDTLTAHAGGGQTSALALANELNRITTVATAGDSVKLPASIAGLTIIVINHGAKSCQVFGAGTDTIDDVVTATGVAQMAGSVCLYVCVTDRKSVV